MPEALAHIVAAMLFGGLASLLVEALLVPRPLQVWQRPLASIALHGGVWLLWFGFGFLLFQRPFFAAAAGLAFQLLVVMIGNAKFHSLREPFVYQDFEYLTDALRHPRLYIPFLGWGRALVATVGALVAVVAGLALEASVLHILSVGQMVFVAGAIMLAGALALWVGHRRCPKVNFNPVDDLRSLGLVGSIWCYWRAERAELPVGLERAGIPPVMAVDGALPDLVAVQSESFFDARRHFPGLRRDILATFDALRSGADLHGRLGVPSWGANTVRTEFAFLSGLDADALGVHRFNPYRRFAGSGIRTLASTLRALGYRTVCIHPYPAGFYRRDRVFPAIGFDEFIDIAAFAGAERAGPYVADTALAGRMVALLESRKQDSDKPLFVFAITMENHGPLHLERANAGDVGRLFDQPPPAGCDDLTVYARHLANADMMLGILRERLRASPRPAWLAVFGDHVPIMPAVYRRFGEPDGDTDYLVWSNRQAGDSHTANVNLPVDRLATAILERMFVAPCRG